MLKIFLSILIILGFASCGYKPSAKFSRDVVGEKISTSIIISAMDPENTVIVKDAVDEAIIIIFHASLTDKATSDTHLILRIAEPSYTPIVYDENGFIIGYRMLIRLTITRFHSGLSKNYETSGIYDFAVAPNAVVTDQERFEAIRFSSEKAIRAFIAQVSAEGARAAKK